MEEINSQFVSLLDAMNAMKCQLKLLEKNIKREMNKKVQLDKKTKSKKPSGFARPSSITNELCAFMNKEEGTKMARTDVTKTIIEYIKKNNLQKDDNKKVIEPDDKLKILLGINENEELTYFTLQKYMNKHFLSSQATGLEN